MKKEYGGYLPFEITTDKGDCFSGFGEHVMRTNSAKSALWHVIRIRGIKRLLVPYYMCLSVNTMLAESGIEVIRYWLKADLTPDLPEVQEDTYVLLVNYFGILEDQIRSFAKDIPNVVVDNSHAFFAEPVFRPGADTIYSCRKFWGVPDGGYAVGLRMGQELPPDTIADRFLYLVKSAEQGTNAAYLEKRECDLSFVGRYQGMSLITRAMMGVVDYAQVRDVREKNFRALHTALSHLNVIPLKRESYPAYLYPFLPMESSTGERLKKSLVAEKIYVPTLWNELTGDDYAGHIEQQLSRNGVFLPIDQRYTEKDMHLIAETVKRLL